MLLHPRSPVWAALSLCLEIASGSCLTFTHTNQAVLSNDVSSGWQDRVSEDATGNYIFHTLASLLQMAPNSQHNIGHSMVRATVPAGTLFYHGGFTGPTVKEWIAFDPEHAFYFTLGRNLYTYITTRELNLIYFDGASANKLGGVGDAQDILLWGKIQIGNAMSIDYRRMIKGCELAKSYGVDGIVRMEADFEIMYCDFLSGLELVSEVPIINIQRRRQSIMKGPGGHNGSPNRPHPADSSVSPEDPDLPPLAAPPGPGRRRKPLPPPGWKGSLFFTSAFSEPFHAGSWHNFLPGLTRVHADPSTLVTFFDPTLTSLVSDRRGKARTDFRLTNISETDSTRVREDFLDALTRPREEISGVDWQGLVHVIVERFSDRLPFLQFLIHDVDGYPNATAHATVARRHIGVALLPYMSREGIEAFDDWLASTAHACAATFTAALPVALMTKQERVLHSAVKEVLHEVCRVYTSLWAEAFDVEEVELAVAAERIARWATEVDALIRWLDWPTWTAVCRPACGVTEYCRVPQHGPYEDDFPRADKPGCVPIDI